jgi:hypothetical protein
MPAVVAMRHHRLLKAMSEGLLGRGKVKMQVIGASQEETGAFGFWDFKIPKAFRPQLFDCYPLTSQDSIYKTLHYIITDRAYLISYIQYLLCCQC